jgi:hypothetical protein
MWAKVRNFSIFDDEENDIETIMSAQLADKNRNDKIDHVSFIAIKKTICANEKSTCTTLPVQCSLFLFPFMAAFILYLPQAGTLSADERFTQDNCFQQLSISRDILQDKI